MWAFTGEEQKSACLLVLVLQVWREFAELVKGDEGLSWLHEDVDLLCRTSFSNELNRDT